MHTRRQILKCLAALPVVGPVLPRAASAVVTAAPHVTSAAAELMQGVAPGYYTDAACTIRAEIGDRVAVWVGANGFSFRASDDIEDRPIRLSRGLLFSTDSLSLTLPV